MRVCLLKHLEFSSLLPSASQVCVSQPGQELLILSSFIRRRLMAPGSRLSKDDYLRSSCSPCFSKIDIDIGNILVEFFFFFF